DRVLQLERVASISHTRFRTGLENYFASADSQRDLYLERRQAIELQLRQEVNTVNLYKAMGGGWDEVLPERSTSAVAVRTAN
ncbi:MAG TPA: hypothetical protein VLJ19_05205, partial [Variovorax sp.]|nr:hypothetical protein [Variovorax sp.]